MIVSVDGGPTKTDNMKRQLLAKIDYFLSYELDSLFLATIVPGRSAFNLLKQTMISLGKELSGALLEHDHFGSHLDDKGNIIDAELELKNVDVQVKFWLKLWTGWLLTWQASSCRGICLKGGTKNMKKVTEEWKLIHIWSSLYLL